MEGYVTESAELSSIVPWLGSKGMENLVIQETASAKRHPGGTLPFTFSLGSFHTRKRRSEWSPPLLLFWHFFVAKKQIYWVLFFVSEKNNIVPNFQFKKRIFMENVRIIVSSLSRSKNSMLKEQRCLKKCNRCKKTPGT